MALGHEAYRSERTSRDVRLAGADFYYAVLQLTSRSTFVQNDQVVQLRVGDVALLDASRPALCVANNARWLGLQLPRQSLVSHLGFEPNGGLYGSGATAAARLLFNLVLDAGAGDGSASSPADAYMRLAVHDFLGAVFAPSDPWPVSRQADKLFARVRAVVADGFADPDFGPAEVAAATGISLRYLQKLFTQRSSTCRELIYALRLDHAALLLQRRASLRTGQPLSEIAYACGFRDYTHFARKFRQRFGYAPGRTPNDGGVRAGAGERAPSTHDGEPAAG
jgi:AraC family transcriptional activator of tynA and feaB